MSDQAPQSAQQLGPEQHLDEAAQKFGVAPEPAAPAEEAKPKQSAPVAGEPEAWKPAQGLLDRIERKTKMKRLEEDNERLRERLERLERASSQPAQPQAVADPEPDFDLDPKGWYRWQARQDREALKKEFAPVLETEQARRKWEGEQVQQREEMERQQAQVREFAGLVSELEAEYVATPSGQGFQERHKEFSGLLYRHYLQHMDPNDPQAGERAMAQTAQYLRGVVAEAIQLQQNPAEYLDRYIRNLRAQAGQPTSRTPAPPRPRPRTPADPTKTGLASSLGDAPPAGPAAREFPSGSAKEIRAQMASGRTRLSDLVDSAHRQVGRTRPAV